MTIKYSIVIPTRNRAEYLPHAIKSVLHSTRKDIELVVSDNFSTDTTDEILTDLSDPRLRVIRPSVTLPMAGHYEFAISHAKGEWITILGDDDAVMPDIFERLDEYISKYPKIDIISSERAFYFWEGCEDLYGDFVVDYSSSDKSSVRSTKLDLLSTLSGLRSCFDMPQLYTTGIVKRSLFEEIKKKSNGYFYHSIIPDMYSEVALCLARDIYLRVEYPLFWVGTSNKSMGRSDRIYRDAAQFEESDARQHQWVPRRISPRISYQLHSNAFSALYIYECILQSPMRSESHERLWIRTVVLAAVLNDVKKRKNGEKDSLLKEILNECIRYEIPRYRITLLNIVLSVLKLCRRLCNFPERILKRLGWSAGYVRLKSNNRGMFPRILDASSAVARLRAARFQNTDHV